MKQNKTKKPLSKGMKIFLDIAMVVSLLVAGFSAWNIVQVLKGYQESKQAYEEVRKEVVVVDKITKKEKVDLCFSWIIIWNNIIFLCDFIYY